jgi:mono/diheme cytochrome c family protein
MISRTISGAVLLISLLFFSATLVRAQEATPGVKKSPVAMTNPSSGVEMFNTYCAVCHGKDAKGDGPLASELKIPPANLTLLARNHAGKYPSDYVAEVIRSGPRDAKSHGSKDMPVWGSVFKSIGAAGRLIGRLIRHCRISPFFLLPGSRRKEQAGNLITIARRARRESSARAVWASS